MHLPLVTIKARHDQQPKERRRDERVKLSLSGRYALCDGREYTCATIDISARGILIRAPNTNAQMGERVIAYISQIGRIEGTIARRFDSYLAISLKTNAQSRETLTRKLASCVRRRGSGTHVDRTNERVEPTHRLTTLETPDAFRNVEAIVQKLIRQGYELRNEREGVMVVLSKLSCQGLLNKSSPDR